MRSSQDTVMDVIGALEDPALSPDGAASPSELALLRLEALIESERFAPNEKLPGEQRLAELVGVSRSTLREALRALETRGQVVRRPSRGTYLVPRTDLVTETLGAFESVASLAAQYGTEVRFGQSEVRVEVAAARIAAALGLGAEALVRVVTRTLHSPSGPAIHMRDYFSPGLLDMSDDELLNAGVLRPLIVDAVPGIADVVTDIHLVPASAGVARQLHLSPGSSILLTEERLRKEDGEVIELSLNFYNPSRVRFHGVTKAP